MKCSRSQDEATLLISEHSAPADLGTASHDALRGVVHETHVDMRLIAARHGVSEKELGPLVWFGRKAWEELKASFPLPETEVDVSLSDVANGLKLTGHIDVLSIIGRSARGIDWKSGRKEESDYYAQMAGYAACLLRGGYNIDDVTFTVVWLRSQTVETYRFTRSDSVEFLDEVQVHLADARYTHGEHCAYCPRSHECPALIALGRRDAALFTADDEAALVFDLAKMSPAMVVDVRRRAKMLEKFAASLDAAIKWRIASTGALPSGDGYQLDLVEENGKREVDTLKAWPVLQRVLTDEEIAQCVTVSASGVDEIVAKKAGRGNGAAAKRALAEELKALGALEQPKVHKLKEVRLPMALPAKETA